MVNNIRPRASTCTTIRCVHGPLWVNNNYLRHKTLYPTRRVQGLLYEGAAGAERMVSVALANGHDCKGERGSGRLV